MVVAQPQGEGGSPQCVFQAGLMRAEDAEGGKGALEESDGLVAEEVVAELMAGNICSTALRVDRGGYPSVHARDVHFP